MDWDFAFLDFHGGSGAPYSCATSALAPPSTSAFACGAGGLGMVPARYSELLGSVSSVDRGVQFIDKTAAAERVAEKRAALDRKKAAKDPAAWAADTTVAPQPWGAVEGDTGTLMMRYGEVYGEAMRGEDVLAELRGLGFAYSV